MAVRAAKQDMPLATLKTRVKKLVDKGMDRERAVEVALLRPIGPQGRPRRT